ncbi:hypothetical protein Pcinc_039741 [Petrolisthes cinctipes]|uniref:C-type lectin domain-containing protein n=1 Tax=Petrolisthes cinctipes TaxID=88211 RepID=A0AAE1BN20_PETCI|nr:hypothetical protein Pcinc_039741 [Petrolisthes cinctipes]
MNKLLSLGLLMECPIPYVTVGGHCLFFDALEQGSWQHSRNFCEQLQGHLVKIETDNFMADVFDHIHHHGLGDASFWIGANDLAQEGVWKWHDGSNVRMGTPFWAYLAEKPPKQEPMGGTKQNCCCLNTYYLYFFHDYACDLEFSPICEYSASKSNATDSSSRDFIVNGLSVNLTNKLKQRKCYNDEAAGEMVEVYKVDQTAACVMKFVMINEVDVKDRCLYFNPLEKGTWQEVRAICEQLQGHLVKIDTANFMKYIVAYIHDHEIDNQDYWNGANDLEKEGSWRWHDDTHVTMGTPFWGYLVSLPIVQEPGGGTEENCCCMMHTLLYYFHDCSCDALLSPICELDDPPPANPPSVLSDI